MNVFVFDLDNTLIDTNFIFSRENIQNKQVNSFEFYKQNIYHNPIYKKTALLIKKLKGPKILMTNASRIHGYYAMNAMGLVKTFIGQVDRDSGYGIKPSHGMYMKVNDIAFNIKSPIMKRRIIFFDDLKENLRTAKNYNWITVLISPSEQQQKSKCNYIDFTFTSIHQALMFFLAQT